MNSYHDDEDIQEGLALLEDLPEGKLFDDAKSISSFFSRSVVPHHQVVYDYEQGEATLERVSIRDVHITQPNVRSGKVKQLMQAKSFEPIPAVLYPGYKSVVIFDGHHRLAALFLLGYDIVEVSLVRVKE